MFKVQTTFRNLNVHYILWSLQKTLIYTHFLILFLTCTKLQHEVIFYDVLITRNSIGENVCLAHKVVLSLSSVLNFFLLYFTLSYKGKAFPSLSYSFYLYIYIYSVVNVFIVIVICCYYLYNKVYGT